MMDIGAKLAEARTRANLNFNTVEEDTKISVRYLKALEENNFAYLPGEAYCVGFLRTYARYLQLDSDEIIKAFKEIYHTEEVLPATDPHLEEKPDDSLTKLNYTPWQKWKVGLLVTIILLALICGIFYYLGMEREDPANLSDDNVTQNDIENPGNIINPPVTDPEPEPEPEPEPVLGLKIEITAKTGSCWLRAIGTGWSRDYNLKTGDSIVLEDELKISVKYGNAPAVVVTVNGVAQSPFAANKNVLTWDYTAENPV